MRIAIIQPRTPYHVAGSEKVSVKHAEFLSRLGHKIDYYTSIPHDLEETFLFKEFYNKNIPNVSILRFDISNTIPDLYKIKPDTEHVRWITESIAFNERIYRELEENKPDVILSYYLPDSLFKPLSIPNVIYLSGYPSQKIPWYKAFIKFCHATISISSIVAEKWKEEISEVKLNYNLGTGVDYPLTKKGDIQPKAKYNLVFAGRFIERKGVLTLIKAMKDIASNNDIHLWMLGDGELFEDAKRLASKLQIAEKISFTGVVENPYDYFKMADVCTFPSHKGDGLMGTVLESMAAGKPVVTTTNNGNEDVITNGVNGILIEPQDISALVSTINNLIKDDTFRKTIGLNAQKYIEDNMTWEKHSEMLSSILIEIKTKMIIKD